METVVPEFLHDMTMITANEAEEMMFILKDLPLRPTILDIGTGKAHSSAFFGSVREDATVFTVDGYGLFGTSNNVYNKDGVMKFNQEGLELNLNFWRDNGINNVIQIIGDSTKIDWHFPIDFLFIDGDHSFDGVKNDFEKYSPLVNGTIVFHDYNDNYDVKKFIDTLPETWEVKSVGGLAFVQEKI